MKKKSRENSWEEKIQTGAALTVSECAEWLGVSRGRLPDFLEIIPFGTPASSVTPGKIPARMIGNRKLLLAQEILGVIKSWPTTSVGTPCANEEDDNGKSSNSDEETPMSKKEKGGISYYRQIAKLRDRGN